MFMITDRRILARCCLFTLVSLAAAGAAVAAEHPAATKAAAGHVLASIDGKPVTEDDVRSFDPADFQRQQTEFDHQQRQLDFGEQQSRHELLQQQLDKMLDRRALELEAKARDISTDAVLADIRVTAVTDAEVRAFYENNKDRSTVGFDQLAPQIKQYLASQHDDQASRSFYDALRAKHHIRSELAPLRIDVAATGPVRGASKAPVTVVEFGDFQCPYCKQAESTLQLELALHPEQLRVVFRHLPLTDLHPNAMVAAQAAVCADQQGKFWQMHDALYADQDALDSNGLKATAKRLGLDMERYGSCVADPATAQKVNADADAAAQLGIGGTPFFFVNGRPINGSVPQQSFDAIVADELQRAAAPHT